MKFTYNYGQEFLLEEIDFWNLNLIFFTTNSMGKFNWEQGKKGKFRIPYDNIYELQNIPKLLYDYLEKNNLMYWYD